MQLRFEIRLKTVRPQPGRTLATRVQEAIATGRNVPRALFIS